MSVYQNINGTLTRIDASDLVQLAAVDTEGILGGTPGATTNGQTLVDQLAADDVQAQTDIGQIKTDLSDYHVVPSRNICPNKATSTTLFGVTFTVREDGSIATSGVSTGYGNYVVAQKEALLPLLSYVGQEVIASGCPEGGSYSGDTPDTYRMNFTSLDGIDSDIKTDKGDEVRFTVGDFRNFINNAMITIRIGSVGVDMNGKVFKPMIRLATETDSTYEPPYVCMRDGKLDIADYAVNGAINHFNNTIITQTVNTVVWTKNDTTKKLTANGTATGGNSTVYADVTLAAGTWYVTGCPNINVEGDTKCGTQIYLASSPWTTLGWDYGDGVTITLNAETTIRVQPVIFQNKQVSASSCVFELMVSNIKGAPYVPYAMTNAELTAGFIKCSKYDFSYTASTVAKNTQSVQVTVNEPRARIIAMWVDCASTNDRGSCNYVDSNKIAYVLITNEMGHGSAIPFNGHLYVLYI